MARRYVRDKIGRFAAKGGGGKRAGKQSKSTAGRSAKAKYKSASGKLREAQKSASKTKGKSATRVKHEKKALSAAKGGMTRVTNKLTAKRAAATPTKKAATKKRVTKKKAAATRAKTAAKKKVAAKKKTYGGLTPKQQYKVATSKARAAKSGYAQDRGQGYDRAGKASGKGKVKRSMKMSGLDQPRYTGAARGQVTKLQKKFRKGVKQGKGYKTSTKAGARFKELKRQRGGVTKGRGTIAQRKASLNYRTTNQAFGGKNKRPVSKAAMRYIGKRNTEDMRISSYRGKGSKAKRRASQQRRGSAATKRDRILRTAEKNLRKSGGIKSASFDRRRRRYKQAQDIMTKGMGGSTAWKNF